jgi:hypothetical protein
MKNTEKLKTNNGLIRERRISKKTPKTDVQGSFCSVRGSFTEKTPFSVLP